MYTDAAQKDTLYTIRFGVGGFVGNGVQKMANEKRLVNAEAIARKLKNAYCAECNVVRKVQCSACWVEDVLELLEGDAVDAVEVVHGKWINNGGHRKMDLYCSVCNRRASNFVGGYEDWWDLWMPKYCPNCGAKMDGDGNG